MTTPDLNALIERFERWLQNTGFEGGVNSPPMLVLAALRALSDRQPAPLDGEVREIVERLRAKLGKATKRPWRVFSSVYGNDTIAIMKGERPKDGSRWKEIVTWMGFDGTCVGKRFDRANAELIVEAVNALPALLTLIERLSTAQQEAVAAEREAFERGFDAGCTWAMAGKPGSNADAKSAAFGGGGHV